MARRAFLCGEDVFTLLWQDFSLTPRRIAACRALSVAIWSTNARINETNGPFLHVMLTSSACGDDSHQNEGLLKWRTAGLSGAKLTWLSLYCKRPLFTWTRQGQTKDTRDVFHPHLRVNKSHPFRFVIIFFHFFISLETLTKGEKNVIESHVLSCSLGAPGVKPLLSSQPCRNSGDKLPSWVIDASWAFLFFSFFLSFFFFFLVWSRVQKMPALLLNDTHVSFYRRWRMGLTLEVTRTTRTSKQAHKHTSTQAHTASAAWTDALAVTVRAPASSRARNRTLYVFGARRRDSLVCTAGVCARVW